MSPNGPDLSNVTLAVLAGGEGSRMGRPKAELQVAGFPILGHLLRRFDWPGPTLLVTAPGRERPPGYEMFAREAVDPSFGQGPLRGILTAIENALTPSLVAVAVDMPLVERDQVMWLASELRRRPEALAVMTFQRNGDAAQLQPFPSAFRAEAATPVRRLLESNRRSLHAMLDCPGVVAVDAPAEWDARTWTNLNSPGDLDAVDAR